MKETRCDVFWGSHGCDLEQGHDGHHVCDCCDLSDPEHSHAHAEADIDQYGVDGCAGTYPYYGRAWMKENDMDFFIVDGEGNFHSLPGEWDRMMKQDLE